MKYLLLLIFPLNLFAATAMPAKLEKKVEVKPSEKKVTFRSALALGFTRVNFGKELQDNPTRISYSLYIDQVRLAVSYTQSNLKDYVGPGSKTILRMPKVSLGYGFKTPMEGQTITPFVSYYNFQASSPDAGVSLGNTQVARNQAAKELQTVDSLEARSGLYPGISITQELSSDVQLTFEGDIGLFVSGQIGYLF